MQILGPICFLLLIIAISTIIVSAQDTNYINQVVNSIYLAEGGIKAKYPFGILHVTNINTARNICFNTVTKHYKYWHMDMTGEDFITYLSHVYAPTIRVPEAEANLNKNWPTNVKFFMKKNLTNWNAVLTYERNRAK